MTASGQHARISSQSRDRLSRRSILRKPGNLIRRASHHQRARETSARSFQRAVGLFCLLVQLGSAASACFHSLPVCPRGALLNKHAGAAAASHAGPGCPVCGMRCCHCVCCSRRPNPLTTVGQGAARPAREAGTPPALPQQRRIHSGIVRPVLAARRSKIALQYLTILPAKPPPRRQV